MKISYLLFGLIILISIVSCKEESFPEEEKDTLFYQMTIFRNNKIYQEFTFDDNNLLKQLNYDTSGVLTEKIFLTYNANEIRKDFYDADSVLQSYQVYRLNDLDKIDTIFDYNQPIKVNDSKHAYIFNYSKVDGKLSVIMDKYFPTGEHLDVSFKWSGLNVTEKNYPISSGFPQYSYEYDSNPSIFKLIKAPIDVDFGELKVAEIPISVNNVKKVNIKKLVNDDFTFDTVRYELYNTQMSYDANGYLIEELRQYNNEVVKFEYLLDTIK